MVNPQVNDHDFWSRGGHIPGRIKFVAEECARLTCLPVDLPGGPSEGDDNGRRRGANGRCIPSLQDKAIDRAGEVWLMAFMGALICRLKSVEEASLRNGGWIGSRLDTNWRILGGLGAVCRRFGGDLYEFRGRFVRDLWAACFKLVACGAARK